MSFDINKSNNISVTSSADTELAAAAALTDNFANPTIPGVGAFGMLWDGATWDRAPGDATNGITVNLGGNNDVALSATDNAVLDQIQVGTDTLAGPGAPTVDSYTSASISTVANTANQVLVSSAPSKQIWVYGINFTCGTAAGTVSFQDEDDTAVTGVMPFDQNGGMAVSPSGNFAMPLWKLGTEKDLEVDTVTCDIEGSIQYAIVSV